jgi:predicted ATPase/serine/threonine protein kinase/DNA-binding CsgD family transcriptional regulator/Tfp pilus assembly protein PilF
MTEWIGQKLGNYRLIRLLGHGGFADVYLGEHLHLGSQAAIKVLTTRLMNDELDTFRREAQTIARLEHPHIVRVLDFGIEHDTPFLVMSYAPGGSLRLHYPKGTQLPLDTLVSYVRQVADALQYAHNEKLIHRDIKPTNMLLGRHNEILLTDFGLAIMMESVGNQQVREAAGTIAYMAPEQIQGHPGPASDQYALGIVVYEWLTGDRPFHGSFTEIAALHLHVSPAPLHQKAPTVSATVEHVVFKALAKDPQHRFANVQAFATALEEVYKAESSERTAYVPSSGDQNHIGYTTDTSQVLKGKARTASSHNLPAQLTPLIGREQEATTACALLRQAEVRLLTLTGAGGIGKTRLGLQVATNLLDDFLDGVYFIPLAPISDPDRIIPTIAQTFGLKEAGDQSLFDLLKAYLREKHLLLLLDNFEQVVLAAHQLTELLNLCPRLKMLITSRSVLHVHGEHEFPVPPLAVPNLAHLTEGESISHYAAVALFLQRARAIRPDFQMTKTNASAIVEICARLDGLPLAIELAAARIKLLPPQALLARLGQRLAVLTSMARDVPERQQTLRNTIRWSYDLLSTEEQRLFRQLSIFVGGCTLEAAEAVYNALIDANATVPVLDDIASLIDRSLLYQGEQEGEEPRVMMLETIREYGLEVLATSGEAEDAQRAHAAYYLALAEEAEPRLISSEKGKWLARLQWEHENLRAALEWFPANKEQEAALRLGSALWRFWWKRGHLSEGRAELARALTGSRGVVATYVLAKALHAAGALAGTQGDFEQTEALCGESLALFRALGDHRGNARSLTILAYAAVWHRSDFTAARTLVEEAVTLFRGVDDKYDITLALLVLALVFLFQGEYDRARALAEEAVALDREGGDSWNIANSLWNLAQVMFFQSELTQAPALLEESLTLARQEGYKEAIAYSLIVSGRVAMQQGDVASARSQLQEGLVLFKELGDQQNVAQSLVTLAMISLIQGNYAEAQALLEESFTLFKIAGNKWFVAVCLAGFAVLAAARGEWTWAARLSGAAEALCNAINGVLPPVVRAMQEFSIAAARAQLGEEAFVAAQTEGRAMSPEQALAAKRQTKMSPSTLMAFPSSYPHRLTAREMEILRLVARGLTDAQVAQQLVISPRTVSTHLTAIYGKIQVSTRSAATRYAIEHQLA